MKKTHGLGRGLDALLPEPELSGETVREIPLGDIDPNADQPRRSFHDASLQALAASIKEQGVLQPLIVSEKPDGRFLLIAGERRWRASRLARLDTVPCLVRDLDEIRRMEIALIENLQREDLNPIEEAAGIQALMQRCGLTQEKVAERLAKSRPAIANLLRLLQLPEAVRDLVQNGTLTAGHGRAIAGAESEADQLKLAGLAAEQGWSVRQTEQAVALLKNRPATKPKKEKSLPVELQDFEHRLRDTLGLRTKLVGNAKRGRIVLSYYSAEELEHLSDLLERWN